MKINISLKVATYLDKQLKDLDEKLYDELTDYEKGKKDMLNILFGREEIEEDNNK